MPFDPLDYRPEPLPARPDPRETTGWQEWSLLLALALLMAMLLLLLSFPLPLVLAADMLDDIGH